MGAIAKPVLAVMLALPLALSIACSQKLKFQNLSDSSPSQQLPFRIPSDEKGASPTAALVAEGIPLGTPIVVRLQARLSSATCHAGDKFQAVLANPLVVRGRVLATRGTAVEGQVLASKASENFQDPGFLRITLTAITLDGRTRPISASSVFSKAGIGNVVGGSPALPRHDVEFLPSKRLLFRFTQSLPLA